MSYQEVFKRYELKYLLQKEQKNRVLEVMSEYMQHDKFGKSTIRNIYYDTPESLLIRRSLERPVYKEKLRVRSYDIARADSTVFVELKKKYKSVVYKRRVDMTEEEAYAYLNKHKTPSKRCQITDEIDYFCSMYKDLRPAMFISYEREAFYDKNDSELRITFDENILWRDCDLTLQKGAYGNAVLDKGEALMEIKIAGAMPLWLARTLSEEGIYKTRFSKYGNAYLRKMENELNGGKKYA